MDATSGNAAPSPPAERRPAVLGLILTVLALTCFALAAFNVTASRINLVALGLTYLTGAFLITGIPTLN
jgi:hypothetical protein